MKLGFSHKHHPLSVASSREDAWIETRSALCLAYCGLSRPPARTRGLKQDRQTSSAMPVRSRPPARTRGLKHDLNFQDARYHTVASSREDAWIETNFFKILKRLVWSRPPARTRGLKHNITRNISARLKSRPPARTRGLKLLIGLMDIKPRLSRPPARTRGLKPAHR